MKILLIRFSSFGDVTQALSVAGALKIRFPDADVHWVTRREFAPLISGHPAVHKVWALSKGEGAVGLLRLAAELRRERFDRVYDAHNNLRSRILSFFLRPPFAIERWASPPVFARRSVKRWKRFLLFRFRRNTFEMPFSGQRDLLEPLEAWGIPRSPPPPAPQLFLPETDLARARAAVGAFAAPGEYVACAPSAAHALKRWPVGHWKSLIALSPGVRFVLLGGPEDAFIEEIAASAGPDRALNLAGRCDLATSAGVVDQALALVTNDTGLLHVAEQRGRPAIALMGPAPFGFPCRPTTRILELDLPCRPCSKHGQGPCVNEKFQRCLVDITPERVAAELRTLTAGAR